MKSQFFRTFFASLGMAFIYSLLFHPSYIYRAFDYIGGKASHQSTKASHVPSNAPALNTDQRQESTQPQAVNSEPKSYIFNSFPGPGDCRRQSIKAASSSTAGQTYAAADDTDTTTVSSNYYSDVKADSR
ncbi:hypothetical protein F6V30_14300 [Oryzomonas sagensis]|uniref:Uncharacterized protein n=1 Tax=Oryzomonas sagensis TaxID=2603857 RepID=A0ABQ6TL71_9BACT|nr:hypothetical protein [Oryzomonas sagensis]KAB0669004.1 hypothetical protein F6V30_14300 [Oryzomonas sagensis]